MDRRFTVDGGAALESRIAAHMERIREAALDAAGGDGLTALVLGGGYGRGEGAVLRERNEEKPYNDYDLFVIVPFASRRKREALRRRLEATGRGLALLCGVDVDFSRPIPKSAVPRLPCELMFVELKAGHVVIHGPKDILDAMPPYGPADLPFAEGARLLLNRGAGLLLARRRLERAGPELPAGDEDFVIRNIHKAHLALGDVILMEKGFYATSYVRRGEAVAGADLGDVPARETLRRRYAEAVEFKLRPRREIPGGLALEEWFDETVALYEKIHLWFERRRLARPAMDWEEYAALPRRLPRTAAAEAALNAARNVRALGTAVLAEPARALVHPRDRLLADLPGLLYGPGGGGSRRATRAAGGRPETAPHGKPGAGEPVEAFLKLWERFN